MLNSRAARTPSATIAYPRPASATRSRLIGTICRRMVAATASSRTTPTATATWPPSMTPTSTATGTPTPTPTPTSPPPPPPPPTPTQEPTPPVDPNTVASALDRSVTTDIASATQFLYLGT